MDKTLISNRELLTAVTKQLMKGTRKQALAMKIGEMGRYYPQSSEKGPGEEQRG